jgi:hypothetical protein
MQCLSHDISADLLGLICRLRLYYAVLVVKGIDDVLDLSNESALAAVYRDVEDASSLTGKDEADVTRRQVDCIIGRAEVRLKGACIGGWLHRGNVLENYLRSLINGYLEALAICFSGLFAVELHSEVLRFICEPSCVNVNHILSDHRVPAADP